MTLSIGMMNTLEEAGILKNAAVSDQILADKSSSLNMQIVQFLGIRYFSLK